MPLHPLYDHTHSALQQVPLYAVSNQRRFLRWDGRRLNPDLYDSGSGPFLRRDRSPDELQLLQDLSPLDWPDLFDVGAIAIPNPNSDRLSMSHGDRTTGSYKP
jgi:hypothetical protein